MPVQTTLCLVLAYLSGSFPSAYVISRLLAHVDIRQVGDGNIGARNTFRQVGRQAGIVVAALDVAKGSIPVLVAHFAGLEELWVLITGAVAVLGHDFMLFLGFQGGQGMATTVGVLLVVLPWQTCAGLCLSGLTWLLSRHHFDLSMAIGLGSIPALAWAAGASVPRILYPVFLLPIIALRKLANIHALRGSSVSGDPGTKDSERVG